jgi:hypothetical protein
MKGINFDIILGFNMGRRTFDINIGQLHAEACWATWNLGANSAFALGPWKIKENFDRFGRSQHLPNADRLLASSPALNIKLVTIWLLF